MALHVLTVIGHSMLSLHVLLVVFPGMNAPNELAGGGEFNLDVAKGINYVFINSYKKKL